MTIMTPHSSGTDPTGTARTASPERPGAGGAGHAGQLPVVPLTGAQYALSAGSYHAVVTELGAGLRELSYDGKPVISGYQPDELPPAGAGQLLAPWPNRVDRGRYKFGGADYQLDLSEAARGNAIHGLTRWAAWIPVRHEPDSVFLKHLPHGYAGYPFCIEIDAEYRLTPATGLQVAITAVNRGSKPAPYGTGQHPYLTVGAPVVDECELTLPATRWLPADDRGIPSGPAEDIEGTPYDFRHPRTIGTTQLDHALTGLERAGDGRAWARLRAGGAQVTLWAGEGYRWLQVFTGDALGNDRRRKALAVEPMTCPPNAFNTGDDLIVLAPGETVTHTWGIQAQFT
jgi:aldose 1-epimerase